MHGSGFPRAPAVQSKSILVAACDTLTDSTAMARWILPVLQEWPQPIWHLWMVDATSCHDIRAAKLREAAEVPVWQPVAPGSIVPDSDLCSIVGGRTGLVIFAHDAIVIEAVRGLDGLVAKLAVFAVSDPLAKPFRKYFASFGVYAGI